MFVNFAYSNFVIIRNWQANFKFCLTIQRAKNSQNNLDKDENVRILMLLNIKTLQSYKILARHVKVR